MENITCTFVTETSVLCNNTLYQIPEERLTYNDMWFWIYLGVYVALVLFAGLMSGLTMGLLSLDIMSLKVLKEGGTPTQKRHASRILPVVKRHHLLLVTLLLANAAAVESMPLFLDRVSDPVTAILVSVTAVLLFGEVFPQALCTRFGLAIGATLVPLVYFMIGLFFIVAWPLSKLLDCLLGTDHATFFRRAELKALVDLHGPKERTEERRTSVEEVDGHGEDTDEVLTVDEVLIIKGALDMRNKTVKDAMVPLESVFMVDINDKLDHTIMDRIVAETHSRVPIFENRRENIVGILLVKMIIAFNPADAIPIRRLVDKKNIAFRETTFVQDSMPLFNLLNEFQKGKSHLSVVMHNPTPDDENIPSTTSETMPLIETETSTARVLTTEVLGIITLEDVIEELIQEEIIDETDVYVDVHKRIQVARARAARSPSVLKKYPHLVRSKSHPPTSKPVFTAEVHDTVNSVRDDQVFHQASVNTPLLNDLDA